MKKKARKVLTFFLLLAFMILLPNGIAFAQTYNVLDFAAEDEGMRWIVNSWQFFNLNVILDTQPTFETRQRASIGEEGWFYGNLRVISVPRGASVTITSPEQPDSIVGFVTMHYGFRDGNYQESTNLLLWNSNSGWSHAGNSATFVFNELGHMFLGGEWDMRPNQRISFYVFEGDTPQQPPTQPPVENRTEYFEAEAISVGVLLRWNFATGGLGYRVFRSETPHGDGISITDFYITTTSFVDVNARANTTYYYWVRQVMAEARPFEGIPELLGEPTRRIAVTTGSMTDENLVPPSVGAQRNFILMTLDSPYMNVNGVIQEIDEGRGTTPIILNSRTIVPIRAIVEAMNGSVGWQASDRQITLNRGQTSVSMWVDSLGIVVNGASRNIDVPPVIINGRTMVPIRFAAENLGSAVDWINSTRQIVIIFY